MEAADDDRGPARQPQPAAPVTRTGRIAGHAHGGTGNGGAVTRAVLVSGHLVDTADRSQPRFPQTRVPWVTDRVREVLDGWRIGSGTTLISGGARGADLIAADEAQA